MGYHQYERERASNGRDSFHVFFSFLSRVHQITGNRACILFAERPFISFVPTKRLLPSTPHSRGFPFGTDRQSWQPTTYPIHLWSYR